MRGDAGPRRPSRWPGALLLAAGGVAGAEQLRSYDLFWHLATGARIVEAGAVPRVDPFSFTAAGAPWVDHSWLFQVGLWAAWSVAGLWGPWLVKVACGVALAGVLGFHLRRSGVTPLLTVALVAACLGGMRFRMMARPELATLLMTAVTCAVLLTPGRGGTPPGRWRTLAVVPLAALWMNLHGGAILAPMLVGAVLAGALLRASRRGPGAGEGAPWGPLALALPLSAAALLLNPYGARVLTVPLRLTELVSQPWATNPEWAWPDPRVFPLLYGCVGAWLLGLVRVREGREPAAAALGLLGALLALRYVRNIGVFFVLLPFAAAPLLRRAGSLRVRPGLLTLGAAAGVLWIAAAPPWLALSPRPGRLGPGLEAGRYPVEASDFLEREGIDGRLFNEVAFGGYLIWRFPGRPVFIDGRNEIYPELLEEIGAGLADVERFWEMIRRWEIEAAVLRYPAAGVEVRYPRKDAPPLSVERSWSEVFFPDASWALVHWDDTAMVRVRRDAVDPGWLARHEYRHLNPDDWPYLRREIEAGRIDAREVRQEIDRRLQVRPDCVRARNLRSSLERLSVPGPGDGNATR